MRDIKKLRNCEIIRNTERSCSDRRGHGGSEGSLGAQGLAIDGLGGLRPAPPRWPLVSINSLRHSLCNVRNHVGSGYKSPPAIAQYPHPSLSLTFNNILSHNGLHPS